MRLANLMQLSHHASVDLYCEEIVAEARLVIVRLLGEDILAPRGRAAYRDLRGHRRDIHRLWLHPCDRVSLRVTSRPRVAMHQAPEFMVTSDPVGHGAFVQGPRTRIGYLPPNVSRCV